MCKTERKRIPVFKKKKKKKKKVVNTNDFFFGKVISGPRDSCRNLNVLKQVLSSFSWALSGLKT